MNMKICYVVEDFLEYRGGRRVVSMLSKELIERDHEITVVTPKGLEGGKRKAEKIGIKVRTFPAIMGIPPFLSSRIPKELPNLKKFDLVHSHSCTILGWLAEKFAERFFLTTHGLRTSINQERGIPGWIFHKLITERVLNSANSKGVIFTVSSRDLEQCKALGFKNSILCPNGVDFEEIAGADGNRFRRKYEIDGLMILEVAQLCHSKGQLRFLHQCFDMIKKRTDTDITAVFIVATGDKDYAHELQREASGRDDVIVISNAPDEEIWRGYNAADVFILPSEFEGSPLVIQEAAAAGIPSVATNVGDFLGADEVGYCRLVPFWDPKKFAEEVIKLLKDDELRKELGKKGINKAKEMSWESTATKVEEKYREVLERSSKG